MRSATAAHGSPLLCPTGTCTRRSEQGVRLDRSGEPGPPRWVVSMAPPSDDSTRWCTKMLLRSLIQTSQLLEPLRSPSGLIYAQLRISFREGTPPQFALQNFEDAAARGADGQQRSGEDGDVDVLFEVGAVRTRYHALKLCVKASKSSFPTDAPELPDEEPADASQPADGFVSRPASPKRPERSAVEPKRTSGRPPRTATARLKLGKRATAKVVKSPQRQADEVRRSTRRRSRAQTAQPIAVTVRDLGQ